MGRLAFLLLVFGLIPLNFVSSDPATATPPSVIQRPDVQIAAGEDRLIEAMNNARAVYGLWDLQIDPMLESVARARSEDQAGRRYVSHVTPEGMTIFDLLGSAGIDFISAGENIAESQGLDPVEAAIDGFLSSAEHRANVLSGSFDRVGVGAAVTEDGITVMTVVFTN